MTIKEDTMDDELETAIRLALRFDMGYDPDTARSLATGISPHVQRRLKAIRSRRALEADLDSILYED